MKLTIFDLIGPNCVTYTDGLKIYDLIHPELQRGQPVELDFSNIRVIVSVFLNAAVGRLLEDIPNDELNRLLMISNLPPEAFETLKRVIENSDDFYHKPQVRAALDRILTEHAAEM